MLIARIWFLLLAAVAAFPARAADEITVFAAASLTDALNAVDGAFTAKTGVPVAVSFASSSTLARQIEAGAPAQVFLSADEQWMDYLDAKGLIEPHSRVDGLGNSLVLIAPAQSGQGALVIDRRTDWSRLLGSDGRLAVGDPDHVPAGIYAKEALVSLGAWPVLAPLLARAEDVRGALALVERQEAPLGIVYATDARLSDGVKVLGIFPQTGHSPIVYPFAIVRGAASSTVETYFRFLTGPQARRIFNDFGFVAP